MSLLKGKDARRFILTAILMTTILASALTIAYLYAIGRLGSSPYPSPGGPLSVAYVSTSFSAGNQTGPQITVPVNTLVTATVLLYSGANTTVTVDLTVKRDIYLSPDQTVIDDKNIIPIIAKRAANASVTFTASEGPSCPTGCILLPEFRSYFLTVTVNGQTLFGATDPSSRPSVRTVAATAPAPSLKASFAYRLYSSSPGGHQTVLLNATGTSGGTRPYNYSWAFGNGLGFTGNYPSPSVSYAYPGSYTIQLVVTDAKGAQSTFSQTVTTTA